MRRDSQGLPFTCGMEVDAGDVGRWHGAAALSRRLTRDTKRTRPNPPRSLFRLVVACRVAAPVLQGARNAKSPAGRGAGGAQSAGAETARSTLSVVARRLQDRRGSATARRWPSSSQSAGAAWADPSSRASPGGSSQRLIRSRIAAKGPRDRASFAATPVATLAKQRKASVAPALTGSGEGERLALIHRPTPASPWKWMLLRRRTGVQAGNRPRQAIRCIVSTMRRAELPSWTVVIAPPHSQPRGGKSKRLPEPLAADRGKPVLESAARVLQIDRLTKADAQPDIVTPDDLGLIAETRCQHDQPDVRGQGAAFREPDARTGRGNVFQPTRMSGVGSQINDHRAYEHALSRRRPPRRLCVAREVAVERRLSTIVQLSGVRDQDCFWVHVLRRARGCCKTVTPTPFADRSGATAIAWGLIVALIASSSSGGDHARNQPQHRFHDRLRRPATAAISATPAASNSR